jgi:hypothetical protein
MNEEKKERKKEKKETCLSASIQCLVAFFAQQLHSRQSGHLRQHTRRRHVAAAPPSPACLA